jgi:hypothetical protein
MRIACLHIPQFALQCATRIDPSLRGAAVAVVGGSSASSSSSVSPVARGVLHAPIVLGCSRAAWALGARIGMTATTARTLSPDLAIVTTDAALERDAIRAIADVLLTISPVVDVGGRVGPGAAHLALYCEVPPKTRGTSFGDRLLERLESLGLTARVGIADDRFTAWVAASSHVASTPAPSAANTNENREAAVPDRAGPARLDDAGVVSVPRGGSAAFLAPRPLSLLAISPEVQHMLEALGVRTLGEFAALPAPTVSSRGTFEADYQALARGESGNALRPYSPDAPIREEALVRTSSALATSSSPTSSSSSSSSSSASSSSSSSSPSSSPIAASAPSTPPLSAPAAVALLAERVAMRLAGRARCAARLEITVTSESGDRTVSVAPVRDASGVLSSAEELAEAIGSALDDTPAQKLRVTVTGEALAGDTTFEEVVAPTQSAFATASPSSSVSSSSSSVAASPPPAVASSSRRSSAPDADTLALVLSTTGTFGLTSPIVRDAHRRTRRGKQRRRTPASGAPIQPRLFKL